MAKSYTVGTPSTVALFTTAEAKTHLKVDTTADDTYIDNLVSASRLSAEIFTNRFLKLNEFSHVDYSCETFDKLSIDSAIQLQDEIILGTHG